MASRPSDDLLFDMNKNQVLKHLRSKMNPDMLRTLERLKDGHASTSDLSVCKLRLESFLASMVAREDVHTSEVSDLFLCGLNSRLESIFGSVLSKEVISGIVGVFALHGSKTPSMQEENEKLVIDVLKFLVESKMNGSEFLTPPLKHKDVVIVNSPAAPAKRPVKKGNPIQEPYNVDAKVLFPEVQDIYVIDGPSKTNKEPIEKTHDDGGVVFLKEVSLNDKLNKLCKSSDALYNKNNVVGSKVDEGGAATVKKTRSPSLEIVSEERGNAVAGCVSIPRFPLTPREKMAYNAVFSLAKSKHARYTVVDIGGCNLRYFSLSESMAPGNEVCSYVVNVFC